VHWGASLDRDPTALRRGWDRICELFATGHIDPLIHSTRPLDEAVEALADLDSRRTVGKVVIVP
jgi:NADPH:quinone reductase